MDSFKNLGLNPNTLDTITSLGFTTPTPIQEQTIPVIIDSTEDIIGLAQTGTGKTAAFGLPIIQLLDKSKNCIQAIILSPTRELCLQITKDMMSFAGKDKSINILSVYGGASIIAQIKSLKSTNHIIVGTPGRVKDLINRKVLNITNIDYFVLDEADEMLNMGFLDDINEIFSCTPKGKRTFLFSATMSKDIQQIALKFMNNPIEISVGKRNEGALNVRHIYYLINPRDRFEALQRIVDLNPKIYGIVFCRTRQETKEVAEKLISHGYNADALHGDLAQSQRDHVMHRFRAKNIQVLIATDVAARGLDVNDLSHIINYNLPDDYESYIHRSGRTGRAGKSGISIALLSQRELYKVRELEKKINKKFEHHQIPNGYEICQRQLFNLVDNMEKADVDEQQIETFMPIIYKKLNWLSKEDLIKRFVSLEFNHFLNHYQDSKDINITADSKQKSHSSERKRSSTSDNFIALKINIGKANGINTARLIGLINDVTRTRDIQIGKIQLMPSFSVFEVEKNHEQKVIKAFKKITFDEIPLVVTIDVKPESRKDKSRNSNNFNSTPSKDSRKQRRNRY